ERSDGKSPSITITPAKGKRFMFRITVMWLDNPGSQLRTLVEGAGQAALARAFEKTLEIEQFGSGEKTGYYVRLTGRAPKPKEYKYLVQGACAEGNLVLAFTFLTNSSSDADQRQALTVVSTARQEV